MRRTVVLAAVLWVLSAPLARAGGDFVDLAVGNARVWFVGEPGVVALDPRSGRTIARMHIAGGTYPLSVALAGGAAWVASVENGYVWGTLTRIDVRTGKARVVWRRAASSVQYVAVGAGGIWALISSAGRTRIARFSLAGRLARTWSVPDAGRIAADANGCWISTDRRLLQIDRDGRLRQVLRAELGDVATGAGAVWLPQAASVLRIDERTRRIRTLDTGRLELGGFQHDLTAGDGVLWALDHAGRSRSTLVRLDARTGRRTGRADVPGIADALVVKPDAVWVATVIAPANRAASGYDVIRLDPRTLRRTLLVQPG
jgi:hypothetical protein